MVNKEMWIRDEDKVDLVSGTGRLFFSIFIFLGACRWITFPSRLARAREERREGNCPEEVRFLSDQTVP